MMFLTVTALLWVIRQVGLYKMFEKAGEKGWKAFVPVLYTIVWLRLAGKPLWWLILFFIPGINVLMSIILSVDIAKCFNRFSLGDHAAAAILPFLYFPYLGFTPSIRYVGPEVAQAHHRTKSREWIDAIAFAIIAATVIRSFFIEAYTIPTPSMEETLLVDDFLFVSKLNFGARVPMTPLSFPLAHNTLPLIGGKSYLEWPKVPYYRLPGWEKIENGDIVVFNYPADMERPVDKRDNFIKRCIAIPGDSLRIDSAQTYINGKHLPNPAESQQWYNIITTDFALDDPRLKKYGISSLRDKDELQFADRYPHDPNKFMFVGWLSKLGIDGLKQNPAVEQIIPRLETKGQGKEDIYPYYPSLGWNMDFFGPIYVPKKGAVIPMNVKNYHLYQKCIRDYEGNADLTLVDSVVYLYGKPLTEYKFQMDYYFMMGDNRHNSLDSRFWGFVPEDHIVGKPVIIWFSIDKEESNFFKKIRWSRLLQLI